MTPPRIPLAAMRAAAAASLRADFTEGDDGFSAALEAAWPHLYAAALRHAMIPVASRDPQETALDVLRRLADEATP